jgi:uncharacterized membrane protein
MQQTVSVFTPGKVANSSRVGNFFHSWLFAHRAAKAQRTVGRRISNLLLESSTIKHFSCLQSIHSNRKIMPVNTLKRSRELNVPLAERALSIFTGGLLLMRAFRPKKGFGLLSALGAGYMLYRGYSGHDPLYQALDKPKLDNPVKNLNIKVTMFINKPRKEIYTYWRNFENLPLFMTHLEKVTNLSDDESHWKANVPGNITSLEWDAKIVKEVPGELIAWQSLGNSTIQNAGKVEFSDAGKKATEVNVVISYIAPLGLAGNAVMQLFNRKVEQLIASDIMNFKQHFEGMTV